MPPLRSNGDSVHAALTPEVATDASRTPEAHVRRTGAYRPSGGPERYFSSAFTSPEPSPAIPAHDSDTRLVPVEPRTLPELSMLGIALSVIAAERNVRCTVTA